MHESTEYPYVMNKDVNANSTDKSKKEYLLFCHIIVSNIFSLDLLQLSYI